MEKNNPKLEVVFNLSNGRKLLVDVGPLVVLFEENPSFKFAELVEEIQEAKDVMVNGLSPNDAHLFANDLKDAYATLTLISKVFSGMSMKEVANA